MYSLTQTGNLVSLLSLILGVSTADANGFLATIFAIIAVVGNIVSWYGRWRKGDITIAGFRK